MTENLVKRFSIPEDELRIIPPPQPKRKKVALTSVERASDWKKDTLVNYTPPEGVQKNG